jgi:hypothetical protein
LMHWRRRTRTLRQQRQQAPPTLLLRQEVPRPPRLPVVATITMVPCPPHRSTRPSWTPAHRPARRSCRPGQETGMEMRSHCPRCASMPSASTCPWRWPASSALISRREEAAPVTAPRARGEVPLLQSSPN